MWRVFSKAVEVGLKWGFWRDKLKNWKALRPLEWAAKRRPSTAWTSGGERRDRGMSVGWRGRSGTGWSLTILTILSISDSEEEIG